LYLKRLKTRKVQIDGLQNLIPYSQTAKNGRLIQNNLYTKVLQRKIMDKNSKLFKKREFNLIFPQI